MKLKCLLIFLGGMSLSLVGYAFFAEWTKMPMQMMQMTQPQAQQPVVCDCRCN